VRTKDMSFIFYFVFLIFLAKGAFLNFEIGPDKSLLINSFLPPINYILLLVIGAPTKEINIRPFDCRTFFEMAFFFYLFISGAERKKN
jgi:hypothetical protein